jgi:hypothetical protein
MLNREGFDTKQDSAPLRRSSRSRLQGTENWERPAHRDTYQMPHYQPFYDAFSRYVAANVVMAGGLERNIKKELCKN